MSPAGDIAKTKGKKVTQCPLRETLLRLQA